MDRQMKILMMERDHPELLKQLDVGNVEVVVKGGVLSKKRIIVRSEVLYKLEEEGKKLLDLGHEVIKPVHGTGKGYAVILTHEKNPDAPHLKMKRIQKELKDSWDKLNDAVHAKSEGGKDGSN